MKVLFDQNVPKPLIRYLVGHEVKRAAEMGWEELKNGDLLLAAEGRFEVLVSCDRNLTYQKTLAGRVIAVVALSTNYWPLLLVRTSAILAAVNQAASGTYVEV